MNSDVNYKKIIGKIVLLTGITIILISLVMIFIGCSNMNDMDDWNHMGPVAYGFSGILISLPILVVGQNLIKSSISTISQASLTCGISGSLGIMAYILAITCYTALILSLLAIILGVVSLAQIRHEPALVNRDSILVSRSKAGLILGIIVFIPSLALVSIFLTQLH